LFLAVTLLAGCSNAISIAGSGDLVTREEAIAGFDKVDASHSFKVEVRQGEAFSVIVRVDDNLVKHLRVVKQGSTLKIGLKPNRIYNIRRATMQAVVTMPELTGLDLSGASQARVTGFKSTQALDVDLSGASHLRGDIEAGNARFDLSGASEATLTGSAQDVTIDASGASEIDLTDFPVADAKIELSGGSEAIVKPSGRLDVNASGGSDIYYLGSPTRGEIDTSGGSSVKPK
jgi:hypothetical protein